MPNDDLKKSWSVFFLILFDPFNVVLVGLYVVLNILGYLNKENSAVFYFIYVASTILAGFAGSRMYKLWSDYNEIKVATARGKTAIANLYLLCENIIDIKIKTKKNIDSLSDTTNIFVIKAFLEEICGIYEILQRESINAIENWSDIIPEANIKEKLADLNRKIADINETETLLNAKNAEIEKLSGELSHYKDKTTKERTDLEEKIKQKEKEVSELNKKLSRSKVDFSNSSIISMLSSGTNYELTPLMKLLAQPGDTNKIYSYNSGLSSGLGDSLKKYVDINKPNS